MARFELNDCAHAMLGEAPAGADTFFDLGMMYSTGRQVPIDYVSAHKWFNLAAMHGHADAGRLRREVAAEMTDADIGAAQRLARDWMKARAVRPPIRAAA
jgi:TPR repeat protein